MKVRLLHIATVHLRLGLRQDAIHLLGFLLGPVAGNRGADGAFDIGEVVQLRLGGNALVTHDDADIAATLLGRGGDELTEYGLARRVGRKIEIQGRFHGCSLSLANDDGNAGRYPVI